MRKKITPIPTAKKTKIKVNNDSIFPVSHNDRFLFVKVSKAIQLKLASTVQVKIMGPSGNNFLTFFSVFS
jgi:hypothetical protein